MKEQIAIAIIQIGQKIDDFNHRSRPCSQRVDRWENLGASQITR